MKTKKINTYVPAVSIQGAKLLGVAMDGKTKLFSISDIRGDGKGVAAADTVPLNPSLSEYYLAKPGVTYANFLGSNGLAIQIPTHVGDDVVLEAKLVWSGTYWIPVYTPVTIDLQDYAKNEDFEKIRDLVNNSFYSDVNNGLLAFTDENGFINAYFDENGDFHSLNIKAKSFNGMGIEQNDEYDFVVTDPNGWILSYIKNGVSRTVGGVEMIFNSDYLNVITDPNGWITSYQDFLGVWHYSNVIDEPSETEKGFIGNIFYTPSHGQSNSLGQGGANSTPLSQPYDNIMFNGGLVPQFHPQGPPPKYLNDLSGYGDAYNSFVDLISHTDSETLMPGMTETAVTLIANENNIGYNQHDFKFLCSAPGEGGQLISQLSPGGYNWDRNIHQMQRAYDLAQQSGKIITMPLITWWQGEADASQNRTADQYKTDFKNYYDALNSAAKSIFKQKNDIKVIIIQLQSENYTNPNQKPKISWAQYEIAMQNPNFYILPFYFGNSVDNQHFQKEVYRRVGGLAGVALKRMLIDGEKIKPIYIKNCNVQGKIVTLKYHVPVLPLVLDTSEISNPGNYGYKIMDGLREVNILSVEKSGPENIKIVSDENIEGFDLYYGYNGAQYVPGVSGIVVNTTYGMRGNLRDSQGDEIKINIGGNEVSLHNYCPITPAYKLINN